MTAPDHDSDALQQMRQTAAQRLREFRELRSRGALCVEGNELLAGDAAQTFLEADAAHGYYLADAITLLAEISTLEDPCLAEPGHRATFPRLIETLSDSFDPSHGLLYDRAFAQMISIARNLPAAAAVDAALRRFGLGDERAFLLRKARLRDSGKHLESAERSPVRKALILSRVTLGADVAVTSIALQKARLIFPNAERVLIGPARTAELFGGDPTLRFVPVAYQTAGGLLERLQNWLPVLAAVDRETVRLSAHEYVVIDPDSRLLQLGMLPAVRDESRYFFFESRRWEATLQDTISMITSKWLGLTFGDDLEILPAVWLRDRDRQLGRALVQPLRRSPSHRVVAVSFGDGGNPAKRAADAFEAGLLLRLLEAGCSVALDKGSGEEEAQRAAALVYLARDKRVMSVEVNADTAPAILASGGLASCQLLLWQGGIGAWAGVIAASDEYIGYDSAGQHIAAALRVPLIDLFLEPTSARFRSRWRPSGRGVIRIIDRAGQPVGPHQLIEDVMKARATQPA